MAIQKKTLVKSLKTTKKANVASAKNANPKKETAASLARTSKFTPGTIHSFSKRW